MSATLSAQRTPRPAAMKPVPSASLKAQRTTAGPAALAALPSAAQAKPLRVRKAPRRPTADDNAATVLYLPGHETSYTYDESAEDWTKAADLYYTYDAQGRIASYWADYGDYKERVTNEYDADGFITRQLVERDEDGAGWTNHELRTSQYDPVVKGLVTEYHDMTWSGDAWTDGEDSYRRVIERGTDGIVRTSTYETWEDGQWTAYSRTSNTVENGVVTTFSVDFATGSGSDGAPVYTPYLQIADLVWERTDGQIVTDDLFGLLYDNNRLQSGRYLDEEGDVALSATYDGATDYEFRMEYPATEEYYHELALYTLRTLDENGSYEEGSYSYLDENEDDEFTEDELYPENTYLYTARYDAHGNPTAYYSEGWDWYSEGLVYYEYQGFRYTYDENGAATETIQYTKEPEYGDDDTLTGYADLQIGRAHV